MAEGGNDQSLTDTSNSWESWIGGWVQTAKDKSSTALEMVKKDLTEFSCTMQKETEKVVEKTSSQLKDSLKAENTAQATSMLRAGLSSFLDNVTKALVIPPDEDDNYIAMKHDGNPYDKRKARLHALQLEEETYMSPPRGPPEQFSMWQESFDMDQYKGEVSELLVSRVEVRSLYTRLVPSEVSHAEFWQRYFFRVHQLDLDEARKKSLMLRAEQSKSEALGWDDDEDDDEWSGGEDDDGNLSDWEKLGKASQTQPSKSTASATTTPKSSQIPETEITSSPKSSEIPSHAQPTETTSAISEFKSETEQTAPSTESAPTSSSETTAQAKVKEVTPSDSAGSSLPNIENKDPQSSSDNSQGSSQIPSSDLWSLHIPSDTASAAHDETVEIKTTDQNTNSTRDSAVTKTSSAAAAGGDTTSSEVKVEVSADGACGAADTQLPCDILPEVQDTSASTSCNQPEQLNVDTSASNQSSQNVHAGSVPSLDTLAQQATEGAVASSPCETSNNFIQSTEEGNANVIQSTEEGNANVIQSTEEGNVNLSDQEAAEAMKMKVKGDMVVVGDRGSPSSEESADLLKASGKKLGEDWDEEFGDIDVTEDDLKAAEDIARRLGDDGDNDDWENWE